MFFASSVLLGTWWPQLALLVSEGSLLLRSFCCWSGASWAPLFCSIPGLILPADSYVDQCFEGSLVTGTKRVFLCRSVRSFRHN